MRCSCWLAFWQHVARQAVRATLPARDDLESTSLRQIIAANAPKRDALPAAQQQFVCAEPVLPATIACCCPPPSLPDSPSRGLPSLTLISIYPPPTCLRTGREPSPLQPPPTSRPSRHAQPPQKRPLARAHPFTCPHTRASARSPRACPTTRACPREVPCVASKPEVRANLSCVPTSLVPSL